MAMWWNCLRFVDRSGIDPKALAKRAGVHTNLKGMLRWGYVRRGADGLIRLTKNGGGAKRLTAALLPDIEARWSKRFGAQQVAALRSALDACIERFHVDLPDCLPILGFGLATTIVKDREPAAAVRLPLVALLAKTLLAYALHYERGSPLSLAIAANVLPGLDTRGVVIRDLPKRTGVALPSIDIALNFLASRKLVELRTDTSGSRPARTVRLTSAALLVRDAAIARIGAIEQRWSKLLGHEVVDDLCAAIEPISGTADGQRLLRASVEPEAGNWRAKMPPIERFPAFPMTLHRGGYPDGS